MRKFRRKNLVKIFPLWIFQGTNFIIFSLKFIFYLYYIPGWWIVLSWHLSEQTGKSHLWHRSSSKFFNLPKQQTQTGNEFWAGATMAGFSNKMVSPALIFLDALLGIIEIRVLLHSIIETNIFLSFSHQKTYFKQVPPSITYGKHFDLLRWME